MRKRKKVFNVQGSSSEGKREEDYLSTEEKENVPLFLLRPKKNELP